MTTTTAPPAKGAAAAAPALTPFRTGTQPTVKPSGYVQANALGASAVPLPDYQIGPTNILRGLAIEVTGTTSGNSASVAFNGDMPLGVLSTVNFQDSGGNSIVGSFDSYTLAMIMKYGGYASAQQGDPRNSVVYSATTGTGATGGSFNFVLRIPVEAVSRTGLGSLQNQTTQSPLVLSMTLTTEALVYSTSPTTAPSVSVSVDLLGYWKGANSAASPSPKAYGTTQYWNRVSNQALNGAADFYLQQLGFGNPWRNILFLNYLTGGARNFTDFPSPLTINWKGNLFRNVGLNYWKDEMARLYGLTGSTADTGPGLDTGVLALSFAQDFDKESGAELGLGYLDTSVGDAFEMIGSWGASCTLYSIINFFGVNGPASSLAGLV
jgi:hypothetical protein